MASPSPVEVCEHFLPEIRDFVRRHAFREGIEPRADSKQCRIRSWGQPPIKSEAQPSSAVHSPQPAPESMADNLVVCGARAPGFEARSDKARGEVSASMSSCFSLIAPEWLIDNLARDGAYLVSPGWLEDWKAKIDAWGFPPDELKAFALESFTRICLLDTLVLPESERRLEEMAAYVGLPALRIPLGMDYCDERLRVFFQDRLEVADKASASPKPAVSLAPTEPGLRPAPDIVPPGPAESTTPSPRPEADYAMALDLLAQLTLFRCETEVIASLLDIFSLLFAPSELFFLRFDAQGPAGVLRPFRAEEPPDASLIAFCDSLSASTMIGDREGGIALPLDFQECRLGLVYLDGFAMPERREAYRNLMESIGPICALSLSNARNFDALLRGQEELKSKHKELLAILAFKNRLLSIISHDLRGPIGALAQLLQFLEEDVRDKIPETQTTMLIESRIAAENAFTLLQNLLEWAKLQNSAIALMPRELRVGTLVASVFGILRGQALMKNIDLKNAVDPELLLDVDPNAMETILRNLVSNALKFTPSGGIVRIEGGSENGTRRIEVRDSGIGMTPETLARAFDLSERVSTVGTQGERGSGLGLVLCRDLTIKCGGSLRMESQVGKGTSVFLTFPPAMP